MKDTTFSSNSPNPRQQLEMLQEQLGSIAAIPRDTFEREITSKFHLKQNQLRLVASQLGTQDQAIQNLINDAKPNPSDPEACVGHHFKFAVKDKLSKNNPGKTISQRNLHCELIYNPTTKSISLSTRVDLPITERKKGFKGRAHVGKGSFNKATNMVMFGLDNSNTLTLERLILRRVHRDEGISSDHKKSEIVAARKAGGIPVETVSSRSIYGPAQKTKRQGEIAVYQPYGGKQVFEDLKNKPWLTNPDSYPDIEAYFMSCAEQYATQIRMGHEKGMSWCDQKTDNTLVKMVGKVPIITAIDAPSNYFNPAQAVPILTPKLPATPGISTPIFLKGFCTPGSLKSALGMEDEKLNGDFLPMFSQLRLLNQKFWSEAEQKHVTTIFKGHTHDSFGFLIYLADNLCRLQISNDKKIAMQQWVCQQITAVLTTTLEKTSIPTVAELQKSMQKKFEEVFAESSVQYAAKLTIQSDIIRGKYNLSNLCSTSFTNPTKLSTLLNIWRQILDWMSSLISKNEVITRSEMVEKYNDLVNRLSLSENNTEQASLVRDNGTVPLIQASDNSTAQGTDIRGEELMPLIQAIDFYNPMFSQIPEVTKLRELFITKTTEDFMDTYILNAPDGEEVDPKILIENLKQCIAIGEHYQPDKLLSIAVTSVLMKMSRGHITEKQREKSNALTASLLNIDQPEWQERFTVNRLKGVTSQLDDFRRRITVAAPEQMPPKDQEHKKTRRLDKPNPRIL